MKYVKSLLVGLGTLIALSTSTLSTQGCMPEDCHQFTITGEGFTQDDKARIESAFKRTNEFIGYQRFSLVEANGCPITRHAYPIDPVNGAPIHDGTMRKDDREMWIGDKITYDLDPSDGMDYVPLDGPYLERVVMHELGHGGGMEHHTDHGIMNDQYSMQTEDWSAADRKECKRSGLCS